MIPTEPPALHPRQSAPRPETIATAKPQQRRRRQRVLVLAIVAIALFGVPIGWYLQVGSRSPLVEAFAQLADTPNLQLKGSLSVNNAGRIEALTGFTASRQPNGVYASTAMEPSGRQQAAPLLEVFIDETQTTYTNLHDASFLDALIRDANPATALQLLQADAVFSRQVKDKWLRLAPREIVALYEQPSVLRSLQSLPLGSCVARLLASDPDANRQLLAGLGGFLSKQSVAEIGEESIRGILTGRYRIAIAPESVKAARSELSGLPSLGGFSQCLESQLGSEPPAVTLEGWVGKEDGRFYRLRLLFAVQDARIELVSDVTYEAAPAQTLPKDALTLADVSQRVVTDKDAIDATFQRRLAAFPALNALVRQLQVEEDLRLRNL